MERSAHPAELLDLATASANDPRPVPRTMVVVAHPDDEVLALGGRFTRHRKTVFIHLTDGVPIDGRDSTACGYASLEAYRNARQKELTEAFHLSGLSAANEIQFMMSDQTAAFHLELLTSKLLSLIQKFTPEVILTHPYEGGHPDHDACAVAVHSAVAASITQSSPIVVEATFYHAGPNGIETNCFLPEKTPMASVMRTLTLEERQSKQQLLSCFVTQRHTLRYFRNDREEYRLAPIYDFSKAPHEGELFYERYPWGMTGKRFCELVRVASASEAFLCS